MKKKCFLGFQPVRKFNQNQAFRSIQSLHCQGIKDTAQTNLTVVGLNASEKLVLTEVFNRLEARENLFLVNKFIH